MAHTDPTFWLGTYTADGDGTAAGIVALTAEDSGTLRPSFACEAQSPSWLTVHPQHPVVYASEEFTGRLLALRPDGTRLGALDEITVNPGVCHVSVAPNGAALLTANYGTGEVSRVPLSDDGGFAGAAVVSEPAPRDPYGYTADADTGLATLSAPDASARDPHAHQTRWLPNGLVVSTDLGFDLVRVWRPSASGLVHLQDVSLPRGVGPRHTLWHESGHLHVLTEYSAEIFTLRFDESGALKVLTAARATADSLEDGDTGAEIAIGDRRDRLYAGIRGTNRVATLEVRGDGSELRAIGDVESGGNWPRHHIVDGQLLHVAHQFSGDVATHRLDERTGIPQTLVGTVETGSATCLAPAQRSAGV
ncbi:lactonase family protein [Microbacterium sp. MPKO10]|uniref:lactonase family protein n=1 Tax=Microbacterium sp. MPKO10 TaxID=2989818 RepID=UPI002235AED4|nr:lactonase family protein [Microbacterium sp. MPKO10]MCW4458984.1 lactonase family protein [Microbacterium sp. MPKO10]